MKNYWLITTEYPPMYGGGIGTYCFHNARMLASNGWQVTVFVPVHTQKEDVVTEEGGIRVVAFVPQRTNGWKHLGFETAMAYEFAALIREYLIKEGAPQILESQEYAGIAYYILQYKHLQDPLFSAVKVLLTLHAPSFLYNDYNQISNFKLPYYWIGEMERWCMKAADGINAPSRYMTEAIQPYFENGLGRSIKVVPYPFEVAPVEVRNEHTGPDPRGNWFFFGKLTPQKGFMPLLAACRKLWQAGWNRQLQVIGSGQHLLHTENVSAWYWVKKKYAKELASGKLLLLGGLSPQRWQQRTAGGGVIVIPSLTDNYPFTVLESMAAGNIVLASKQGGQSEIIQHGQNGFLFDHVRINDLQDQILSIESKGKEELQELSKAAVETVRQRHNYAFIYRQKQELISDTLAADENKCRFPVTRPQDVHEKGAPESAQSGKVLTVIVPYFNLGAYLPDCLASIFASTYAPLEVLVVDDGSTDAASVEALAAMEERFPIKVLRISNSGLADARNAGALQCTSQYIAFLDADDKVHPDYYVKAVQALSEKENLHFVGCWANYFEQSNGQWPATAPELPYLLYTNTMCSSSLVYKRSSFLQSGLNDAALIYGLEDWEHVIAMVSQGFAGAVIPEPLFHYRVRKGSMARQFTKEKILYSINYISQKHRSAYGRYASELVGLLNANGPSFSKDNPTLDYKAYSLLPVGFEALRPMVRTLKKVPALRKVAFGIYNLIKK